MNYVLSNDGKKFELTQDELFYTLNAISYQLSLLYGFDCNATEPDEKFSFN